MTRRTLVWVVALHLPSSANAVALPPGWDWDIGPAVAGPVGPVYDMVVWDDGTGEALYVAGEFDYCGGQLVMNIAKWDGEDWSALGWGMWDVGSEVRALAVFNGELIAAGSFRFADDRMVANIARWDGQQWHPFGREGDGLAPQVHDLVVVQDAGIERLYASGQLSFANTTPVTQIASWDGQSWRNEGMNLPPEVLDDLQTDAMVRLIARETPTGPEFAALNGNAAWFLHSSGGTGRIIIGTPDAWTVAPDFPEGGFYNWDLAFFGELGSEKLYVGGRWQGFAPNQAVSVVRLSGGAWIPVLETPLETDIGSVSALVVAEHADGRWLYTTGSADPRTVFRYDGLSWEPVNNEPSPTISTRVTSIACWDHGDNRGIFIGLNQAFNAFTVPRITIDGISGFGVARWGRADCAADLTTVGAAIGDDFYGVPDGQNSAADINYFVNAWNAGDVSIADLTTQGVGVEDPSYGTPDGLVSGADLNYFVNAWLEGCP